MTKECELCGNQGDELQDIEKLDVLVFGRIPIKDIVKEWYFLGYNKNSVICDECLLK